MLFSILLFLFGVVNVWSREPDRTLFDKIIKQANFADVGFKDFRDFVNPLPNGMKTVKRSRKTMLGETEYFHMKYYEMIYIGENNITQFGELWYSSENNATRVQVVSYYSNNFDLGIPVEVIIDGDDEYVITYNQSSFGAVVCNSMPYSSNSSDDFTYYQTQFITPDYDDNDVVWSARLVDMYFSYDDDMQVIDVHGVDAFSEDLVFVFVETNQTDTSEVLFVNAVDYEEFDEDEISIPTTVDCSEDIQRSNEEKNKEEGGDGVFELHDHLSASIRSIIADLYSSKY